MLMSTIGALHNVFNVISKSDGADDAKSLAEMVNQTMRDNVLVMTNGSITKLIRNTIIEPVAIISNSVKHEDILPRVLELNTDIFTGFYLQAVEMLRNLHGLSGSEIMNVTGSDNGTLTSVIQHQLGNLSFEDREFDYITDLNENTRLRISLENTNSSIDTQQNEINLLRNALSTVNEKARTVADSLRKEKDENIKRDKENKELDKVNKEKTEENKYLKNRLENERRVKVGGKVDTDDMLKNALIRNVELTISINHKLSETGAEYKRAVVIPITIKTHVIFTDIENIILALKPNANDKSFSYRLDEFRSGAISFGDLLFAGDIIKEYKSNKFKDKENLLSLINERTKSANTKLLSAKKNMIGFEKFYNFFIISGSDKVQIEAHLNGKIKDERYKEKFLEEGGGLLLTVIDTDYERVQMYIKDIRGVTDTSFKTISKRNGKSNDFEEIVKAMLVNRPPVF